VQKSNNISILLEGCSYDEIMLAKIGKDINLNKYYNAVILTHNFEYDNQVNASSEFDYITSISYI
jgi:hypothetical protein